MIAVSGTAREVGAPVADVPIAYGMFAIPEGEVELGMEQPTRLVQLIHMVMLDFGTVATGAI